MTERATPHEDRYLFAVWSPNIATAVECINMIGCAHLLRQIIPGDQPRPPGYWLIFKDDSWVKRQWRERFPDATTLPHAFGESGNNSVHEKTIG